ncbi:MAG: hypothetical protein ACKVJE_17195 [Pseudomonadales bacterium]
MGRTKIDIEKVQKCIKQNGDKLSNIELAERMDVSVSTISQQRKVIGKPAIRKSGFVNRSSDRADITERLKMINSAMSGRLSLNWLRTPFNGDNSRVEMIPELHTLINSQ